jgi:GAF domain-containing protein
VHIGQEALDRAVEQLRRSQAENGLSLETAMEHLTDSVIAMFGLTGAGLMLIDDDQLVRSILATDELGWALENAQEEAKEGPCVDAVVHGELVATADIAADVRWPRLVELLADHQIGAILGVPIRLAGATVGALNVYVDEKHDWDQSDYEALTTFGRLLEALLTTALFAEQREAVVTQLQGALDSRIMIERCVGLIMGREGIGAVPAFNRLRDIARPSRRKVHDIARELLAEHG